MAKSRKKPESEPEEKPVVPAPEPEGRPVITQQGLAKLAYEKLGPVVKKRVTEQEVLAAIKRIEFADVAAKTKAPRLLVTRLRFTRRGSAAGYGAGEADRGESYAASRRRHGGVGYVCPHGSDEAAAARSVVVEAALEGDLLATRLRGWGTVPNSSPVVGIGDNPALRRGRVTGTPNLW